MTYYISIPVVVMIIIFAVSHWWCGIHLFKKYRMLRKIIAVKRDYSISIDGNEYDIPIELVHSIIDDYYMFMTNIDFFKEHCKDITGVSFSDMFNDDDFDDAGYYSENVTIWLKYRIEFVDKSTWYVDFIWEEDGCPGYQESRPRTKSLASRFEREARNVVWNTDHLDAMITSIDESHIERFSPFWRK